MVSELRSRVQTLGVSLGEGRDCWQIRGLAASIKGIKAEVTGSNPRGVVGGEIVGRSEGWPRPSRGSELRS